MWHTLAHLAKNIWCHLVHVNHWECTDVWGISANGLKIADFTCRKCSRKWNVVA
jgi:hypothetical protein